MADKTFAEYVQDVMSSLPTVDRSMLTGSVNPDTAKYMEDPLWKSRAIKAAAEEEAKKNALDEILPELRGGSSDRQELNPYVKTFLENETPAERDARMQAVQSLIGGLLTPFGIGSNFPSIGQVLGTTNAQGAPTVGRIAQLGQQYNNAPQWVRDSFPFSASTIAASTPMGQANPQQTSMLASQYESMGYSPEASAGLAIASQESAMSRGNSYADGGDYGD